jgi:Flp pilus assembly pilin Flp
MKGARRFGLKQRGASIMPYALLVGLVAVAALLAVRNVGSAVSDLFDETGDNMEAATSSLPPSSPGGGDEGETGTPVLSPVLASATVNQTEIPGECVGVEFENTGTADVTGFSAPVADDVDYETSGCSNTCTGSLAPGNTCTVELRGKATENGALSGSVSLTASAGGTAEVTLSGAASGLPVPYYAFALGGTGGSFRTAGRSVALDGSGYAVVGYTQQFGEGGDDLLIARFDADGTLDWARTLGTSATELGYSIAWDGSGYVVAGIISPNPEDIIVARFTSSGALDWARRIGGTGRDFAMDIEAGGGGYAISGETTTYTAGGFDVLLMRLLSDGTPDWARTLGNSANDNGYGLTWDGTGYAVTGYLQSGGNDRILLTRFTGTGGFDWARQIYSSASDFGADVIWDSAASNYVIAGNTTSHGQGGYDGIMLSLDSDGTPNWNIVVGGGSNDQIYGLAKVPGGYTMFGTTATYTSGGLDFFMVNITTAGALDWARHFGGAQDDNAYGKAIAWDGSDYVVTGETSTYGAGNSSSLFIAKLDSNGDIPSCTPLASASPVGNTGYSYTNSAPSLSRAGTAPTGISNNASPAVMGDWSGDSTPPVITPICP